MKAFKLAATVLLSILLFAGVAAVESVALVRHTMLNPAFYGENGRGAYSVIGQTVVRKMADAVLERAPAIVLKTTDRRQAWALAEQALPPQRVADMLAQSGPDIARFLFFGGDIPMLKDSILFSRGQEAVIKALLQDGVWDMLPDKPSFPAFMPFTPEWNLGYGSRLSGDLWQVRRYAGLAGYAFWLAVSAAVIFAGLLVLLWLRDPKPFFAAVGVVLTSNGALLMALAAAAAYFNQPLAESAALVWPANLAANLFETSWPALFREAMLPFRDVFFIASCASLSLGAASATAGIVRNGPGPAWLSRFCPASTAKGKPAGRRRGPRHSRRA